MLPSSSSWNGTGYSLVDTGYTNCAACNNASRTYSYYGSINAQYQCSACTAGSQLFDYYSGGFQCQMICDPATEYRYSSTSLYCSKKSSAGSSCSSVAAGRRLLTHASAAYGNASCLSGLCGGRYCCNEAAAAESCGFCESSGACSNKSQVGGSCNSSADCYEDNACLSGTCCAFSASSMAPYHGTSGGSGYGWWDTGYTNCTACNDASRTSSSGSGNDQYQCSACTAGSQLFDYHGGFQCQSICDPATEFRSNWAPLTCSNKLTSGSSCSTSNNDASGGCQSGLCGGPQYSWSSGYYSGSRFCCNEAAVGLNNCTSCASGSGQCLAQTSIRPPPPSPPPYPPASSGVGGKALLLLRPGCPVSSTVHLISSAWAFLT